MLKDLLPIRPPAGREDGIWKFVADTIASGAETFIDVSNNTAKAYLVSQIRGKIEGVLLVITPTEEEAYSFGNDLRTLGCEDTFVFPAQDPPSYCGNLPHPEVVGDRIRVLDKISRGEGITVVAEVRAVLQKTIAPETVLSRRLTLRPGDEIGPESLTKTLVEWGYNRESMVEGVGDFSLRGGILDVYSPSQDAPVRIEFFGDMIESMRNFDVSTQRSLSRAQSLEILPAREIIINDNSTLLDAPVASIFDFGGDAKITSFLTDQEAILQSVYKFERHLEILYEEARGRREMVLPPKLLYFRYDDILSSMKRKVIFGRRPDGGADIKPGIASIMPFNGQIDLLLKEMERYRSEGYRVIVVGRNRGQVRRLREILKGEDATVEEGELTHGFSSSEDGIAIITDSDIFGRYIDILRQRHHRRGKAIEDLMELKDGDYVVHSDYGIGVYRGIVHKRIDDYGYDFILIEYAEGDKLYIPTDRIDRIYKYTTTDDTTPEIHRLSSSTWNRVKSRVKESIRRMARELLELYAARQILRGHAFSADTRWQYEFEASFLYEETPDQLQSLEEVKQDMESPKPMDRLICGDVGFGKTEVAMRAAFKAVMDGKQVAVLAPTTILSQQHYITFSERMADYPIRIEVINRFKSPKQQQEIIDDLKSGKVDIIIGTHRLLSDDIVFRDLGLLIIDEEQRFGVRHKEKLKQMRKTVDVIALTATPIPRTLHMSLMGTRDMSVINTPPVDRHPIQTYTGPMDEELMGEAIRRELSRNGQVYVLYNRVDSIEQFAQKIRELIPEARVAVAHGRMQGHQLDRTMLEFMHRKHDILVCTTIIENGIDIPNVNTMIVARADRLGLAQLYQLRGRVGRSDRYAYAYLFYPPKTILPDTAVKRLEAIRDYTDLGSGFKVAMRDLEIRGAGNILGPEQHGHILEVGFDLYCKMLRETIQELKGKKIEEPVEVQVDLGIDSYLPDSYIPDSRQKLTIYKRFAGICTEEDIEDLREELLDRFGAIPPPVKNLLNIARLKNLCRKIGIVSVIGRRDRVSMDFCESPNTSVEKLLELAREYPDIVRFAPKGNLQMTLRWRRDVKLIFDILNRL
ncbi:MAG: transcription-repair coupling factor [bacterium]